MVFKALLALGSEDHVWEDGSWLVQGLALMIFLPLLFLLLLRLLLFLLFYRLPWHYSPGSEIVNASRLCWTWQEGWADDGGQKGRQLVRRTFRSFKDQNLSAEAPTLGFRPMGAGEQVRTLLILPLARLYPFLNAQLRDVCTLTSPRPSVPVAGGDWPFPGSSQDSAVLEESWRNGRPSALWLSLLSDPHHTLSWHSHICTLPCTPTAGVCCFSPIHTLPHTL